MGMISTLHLTLYCTKKEYQDALELSDDSDIEVHPNVDKRSFIRAKQAQIHQDRARRKHQIITLKYERIINDGLLLRIDRLLTALKSHKPETTANADELVLQSLIESAGDPQDDRPPPPPEGVHQNSEQPAYSKMMASLIDQVKQEVDKSKADNRLEEFIKGVDGHKKKVEDLQKELLQKLAELEKEEKRHITSDDIHTGFDVSHVCSRLRILFRPLY
jgi:cell division cycle protein 37